MFPGAGAQVYYNDAGEPIGWDYPSSCDWYDDPADLYDYDEYPEDLDHDVCLENGLHGKSGTGSRVWFDYISGWWVEGRSVPWYCWQTGWWEGVYQQIWECDYCHEPFWDYYN